MTLYVVCCANGEPHRDREGDEYVGEECVLLTADAAASRVGEFDDPDDGGHMSPPLACGPHRVVIYGPVAGD